MPSRPSAKMAEIHDWLEDKRQEEIAALERIEIHPLYMRSRELQEKGMTPFLARLVADYESQHKYDGMSLEDVAEAAALLELVAEFGIDQSDEDEMAIARKQAEYARKLAVNFEFLGQNVGRNLGRLDHKRGDYRRRRRRPHGCLGTLAPRQRQEAERIWAEGVTHGLTWNEAIFTPARENHAVYQRVRRILKLARRMSTKADI